MKLSAGCCGSLADDGAENIRNVIPTLAQVPLPAATTDDVDRQQHSGWTICVGNLVLLVFEANECRQQCYPWITGVGRQDH